MSSVFTDLESYFPTPLQAFIYLDKYSRYRYDLGRRETWPETVERVTNYLKELSDYQLDQDVYKRIYNNILDLKVMPSMRLMAMAGDAARRNNISIYNCSFMGVDSIDAFAEALYISIAGCGVGFSVEKKYISKLPNLPPRLEDSYSIYTIQDSSEGWYDAIRHHVGNLYDGLVHNYDYSKIRPAGSPLMIKGGRASGPDILRETIDYITSVFRIAVNNNFGKLKSYQVHDIMCSLGNCAVAGGVRRSAMISLFDKDDDDMMQAKTGDYNNYRWNANNTVVMPVDSTRQDFDELMDTLFNGMTGEPGIYFKESDAATSPARRDYRLIEGLNPCGEIKLRHMQFCNLSSVICRNTDTLQTLTKKVEIATIIGTIQSMATNFPMLRSKWRENAEEERLLGVDLNGQMDCPILNRSSRLRDYLKTVAIATNKQYSKKLGIVRSAAITCVKPNGNSSQLLDCASGMHPRYSKFYIRNVIVGVHTPVYKTLFASGVPMVPNTGQTWENMTTAVASFPIKSPEGSVLREDLNAIGLLEYWKVNKVFYTEHNPSCTIYYKEDEKEDVRQWIWNHKDLIGGITLLPYSGAKYENMPYVEITQEQYYEAMGKFPKRIRWELLEEFEKDDQTTSARELACMSGQSCEI
jgi:ribonucleoside-triphosphate reductase (thioredoxin)